jgi:preprotein translocase subunit SecF
MAKQATREKADHQATKENDFGRYNFVKMAPVMGGVSLVLVIISIVLLATKGLNYGIDFAGGTEIQVRFIQAVDAGQLRSTVEASGISNPTVQQFGSDKEFLIRLDTPTGPDEKTINAQITGNVNKIRTALVEKFQLPADGVLRVDTVGPQVGGELKRNGVLAAFYSLLAILIYVALRFDYKYAPGAVLCLIHDSLITLGLFSLLGREVNVQIIAAILTLIGYSLNDTIVTFDRIREVLPTNRDMSMKFVINKGINETLGRTILTGLTTLLAVTALFIWGGGVIADISFTLIIGIIVGAYSTIYVAAPMVLAMDKFKRKAA